MANLLKDCFHFQRIDLLEFGGDVHAGDPGEVNLLRFMDLTGFH